MILSLNAVFQIHYWRKYFERLADIVTLKANDSYWFFHYGRERKMGAGGKPQRFLGARLLHVNEAPFLNREGITK